MKKTDFDWDIGKKALVIVFVWCCFIVAIIGLLVFLFMQFGFLVTVSILTLITMFVFIFMLVYSELLEEKYEKRLHSIEKTIESLDEEEDDN